MTTTPGVVTTPPFGFGFGSCDWLGGGCGGSSLLNERGLLHGLQQRLQKLLGEGFLLFQSRNFLIEGIHISEISSASHNRDRDKKEHTAHGFL
jgi:hypothetical protein